MIEPTVGRIVHYRTDDREMPAQRNGDGQPLPAIIVHVNEDGTVNLCVFDQIGATHARTNVILKQPNDGVSEDEFGYCQWMDYQLGQAGFAKPEAAPKPSLPPDQESIDQDFDDELKSI